MKLDYKVSYKWQNLYLLIKQSSILLFAKSSNYNGMLVR